MVVNYVHPYKYKGVKYDTPNNHLVTKTRVEKYCFKCDLFMGREHDFSECRLHDKWGNGKTIKERTCPKEFGIMGVSLAAPEMKIKCKSDEK